jgi:hypothetical protein
MLSTGFFDGEEQRPLSDGYKRSEFARRDASDDL